MVGLATLHAAEGLTIDVVYRLLLYLLAPPPWIALPFGVAAFLASGRTYEQAMSMTLGRIGICAVILGLLRWVSSALTARSKNCGQDDKYDWTKEVVVVTGAASGLGREVVVRLAEKGIKVAVLDVMEPKEPLPPTTRFFKVDVSDREAVMAAAKQVVECMGHPTVVVNNAGVVRALSVLESTQQDIDLTYGVNVKAHYWTAQAFLPEIIKQNHGHVVTIASSTAYIQAPYGVAYCSSKAAALSFHEGLALELAHVYKARRVRTSVICPGHIRTAMFAGFDTHLPHWLAPSLEVETVAQLIVDTVLSGQSQFVLEPFYTKVTTALRAMPGWLADAILFFTKDAMHGVKKRQEALRKRA